MGMTVDKAIKGITTALSNLEKAQKAASAEVVREQAVIDAAKDRRDVAQNEAIRANSIRAKLGDIVSE